MTQSGGFVLYKLVINMASVLGKLAFVFAAWFVFVPCSSLKPIVRLHRYKLAELRKHRGVLLALNLIAEKVSSRSQRRFTVDEDSIMGSIHKAQNGVKVYRLTVLFKAPRSGNQPDVKRKRCFCEVRTGPGRVAAELRVVYRSKCQRVQLVKKHHQPVFISRYHGELVV